MKEKLIRFMRGRYGYDELSKFLLVVSIIFTLLSGIRGLGFIGVLGSASLILVFFRVFSKNFQKCSLQNQKYLSIKNRITRKFQIALNNFKQRKDFRFYGCLSCGQKIRVPKGKGKITITCPKCGTNFSKVS